MLAYKYATVHPQSFQRLLKDLHDIRLGQQDAENLTWGGNFIMSNSDFAAVWYKVDCKL
jgi:hypothetical protein